MMRHLYINGNEKKIICLQRQHVGIGISNGAEERAGM